MSVVNLSQEVVCQSDVCSLWTVLTDTERLNRMIGNNPLQLSPLSGNGAARFLARTRLGGFSVEYEERPFEWEYLKRFQVERRMLQGPVRVVKFGLLFAPQPDGATQVKAHVQLEPRLALLLPVVKLSAGQLVSRIAQQIRQVDQAVVSGHGPPPVPRKAPTNRQALERAAQGLKGQGDQALLDRLVALIDQGSDHAISRLRPFALADEWKVDRHQLLATCLHAVKGGLLELRWDIICPSCRTVSNSIPSLDKLGTHGACQLCELGFDLDLDEAVECTFAPSRSVREVDSGPYCIGGPARTPHVMAQAILPPGGISRLLAPEEPGKYRIFVRGGQARPVELAADAPARLEVRLEVGADGQVTTSSEGRLRVAPGGELLVKNPGGDERHAKLERMDWVSQAATARVVTAMPGFRRDFSSEVLRPGSSLKVSRMGLFFSDLTDSTKLYSTTGDAAAFKLVQDHFDVVVPLVERHRGTLIKTIGDAVMAAFADDLDGLRASLAILQAFEEFRKGGGERGLTHIKLGFYSGPCFALTANNLMDYFGQTVNIAARLQAQAQSGELVVEAALADHAVQAGVLPASAIKQRYAPSLKGVDRHIEAVRISLS